MELQYLRVFYEVAKHGSISSAAKALRITQPSISRSVQNLESSLNQKLFTRRPRGVVLTESGQEVYERCHRIFLECEAIEKPKHEGRRHLRMAASENLCIHVIPKILPQELSLDLFSGTAEEIIRAVMAREADVGYCYHPSKTPGLSCVAVTSVEFWLVASPKRVGSRPTLKQLREMSWVGSFSKSYAGPYAAKTLLAEVGLSPNEIAYQCNSQETQVSMVENGLGYSLVPWFIVADRIKTKKLARIPTTKPLKTPLFRVTRIDASNGAYESLDEALASAVKTQ